VLEGKLMRRLQRAAIVLVPIGSVRAGLLGQLADRLTGVLGRNVVVGEGIALPDTGYEAHRRQWRGDAILAALRRLSYPAAERVLGLTDADCYTPGLNFIFGQATLNGREAFVALPRLRPSFYSLPEDLNLFRQRALKEAVHELGHTWGLAHCPDPRCVMHFSNALHDTDVKGTNFCSRCRGWLEKARKADG
jgi:archaemetzincin